MHRKRGKRIPHKWVTELTADGEREFLANAVITNNMKELVMDNPIR
jgi:hypothetical protein